MRERTILPLLACVATTAGAQAPPVVAFRPAPGTPVFAGPMAGRPVLVDMDGDAKRDVVLACGTCCGSPAHPDSGRVMILRNCGGGRFAADPRRGLAVGPSVRKIAVGDLDGDGQPDVVAAEHDSYSVTALRNAGHGTLVPFAGSPFTAAAGRKAHTHEIALADLDGDKVLDVLTTNASDNAISALRGDSKGGFASFAGSPFVTGRHPYDALAIADFDLDGWLDVAVPHLAGNQLAVLRGDGKGGLFLGEATRLAVSPRPGYVVAADVNRDSVPDLVSTHDDTGVVDVFVGDGLGGFTAAPGSPLDAGVPVWGIAASDLDGDGDADLALGGANGTSVVLLRGDGNGGFASWLMLEAGKLPNYVAVGDVDGDGRHDVVASCYGSGEVWVFLAVVGESRKNG